MTWRFSRFLLICCLGVLIWCLGVWTPGVLAAPTDLEGIAQSVIAAETALHRAPAHECDVRECRSWWWRDQGRDSLLVVAHDKAENGGRVLALCRRDVGGVDDMDCLSSAGRRFTVGAADADHWRRAYLAANQFSARDVGPDLDLICAAPEVLKGDATPGRNPVIGLRVRVASGAWTIRFALADGQSVNRADQYAGEALSPQALTKSNIGMKQPAVGQWVGAHRRKHDVMIVGSLFQDGPSAFRYVELIASTLHPDQPTVMVAQCQSSRPVAFTAPPAPSRPPDGAPPADPPMRFSVDNNKDCETCWTMTARGAIAADSDRAFAEALKEQSSMSRKITMLRLESPGGSVSAALAIGRAIRAADIKTVADQICASACALAFMGGSTRHASPMMLGVHQFSLADSEKLNGAASMAASQIKISELLAYAKEMGVDSEVIGIASATPASEMHFFGATELLALGLNTK